jgi:adenomatosis polyposis coli protein
LSWRADPHSKEILRDVGAVKALMEASMKANKETTMKSFLSALWNFSAHSPENKVY